MALEWRRPARDRGRNSAVKMLTANTYGGVLVMLREWFDDERPATGSTRSADEQ
jgi:hypothetical protein